MLFRSDAQGEVSHRGITRVSIAPLRSGADYSRFMLQELGRHVASEHALVVQWDGFVIDASAWQDRFLDFDYIGAAWPQFPAGRQVGNGGFSLRSRRLLQACLDPDFVASHPEDLAICHENRAMLEQRFAVRIAGLDVAKAFSFERDPSSQAAFGFHGVYNMPSLIGPEAFLQLYRSLDDRRTVNLDFGNILRAILRGKGGLSRAIGMLRNRWCNRRLNGQR